MPGKGDLLGKILDTNPPKMGRPRKPIIESSLSEPQVIKRELLANRYEAADTLAHILYRRRFRASTTVSERKFEKLVITLFIELCAKDLVKRFPDYEDIKTAIIMAEPIPFKTMVSVYFRLCDVLQEIGVEKIEFVREVAPEFAYAEEDILGPDDYES